MHCEIVDGGCFATVYRFCKTHKCDPSQCPKPDYSGELNYRVVQPHTLFVPRKETPTAWWENYKKSFGIGESIHTWTSNGRPVSEGEFMEQLELPF